MKYYWVLNGSILEEFDNFEDAYRILNAQREVFQAGQGENALLVSKTDIQIVCSEEFVPVRPQ